MPTMVMIDHGERIIGDGNGRIDQRARACEIAGGDHGHLDAAAGAAQDFLLIADQHRDGAGTDRADAEQAYFDGIHMLVQ